MPLLLAVEEVFARGDVFIELIEDTPEELLAGALEDPKETLTPGSEELDAEVLGIFDVDE